MTMTLEDLEGAISGRVTYTQGKAGAVIPLKLTANEKQQYQAFIDQGFSVRSRKGRVNPFMAFSCWCSVNARPQIYIKHSRKYAHVELDMILTSYHLSDEAIDLVEQAFMQHCVYRNPRFPGDDIRAGGTFSYCARIPNEQAEATAAALVEIANNRAHWVRNNIWVNEEDTNAPDHTEAGDRPTADRQGDCP